MTANQLDALNGALAGRYVLEREIGRGGMAIVYLAHDVRHDRRVALKVLLPELGAVLGAERFLSEIRVTASLQHPNLLPLFDSGEADGLLFYTMPYVAGESLRRRLDRERQLPVDEAVRLAGQVGEALDYAHRKGVVHRDLKPENILLDEDGHALVADFGIALAVSRAGGARVTQTGLSLGTPQYMSPEQASGDRDLDGRTDVYALGAVTYEMLTGEPPHTGNTVQAIVARVLTETPRGVRVSRPTVPVPVELAVGRALEKIPADRWSTARAFVDALRAKETGETRVASGTAPRRPRHRDPVVVALAAAALLAASAGAWAYRRAGLVPDAPVVRFTVSVPSSEPLIDAFVTSPVAFSPDGRMIAYVASVGQRQSIRVRALDDLETHEVAGTDGADGPFFSPDGAWIAFFVGRTLEKIPVGGGVPTKLFTFPYGVGGAAWGADDAIVVGSGGGVMRVSAAGGGAPTRLTRVDSAGGERYHALPRFFRDGRTFAFAVDAVSGGSGARMGIASLDDDAGVRLQTSSHYPIGELAGHLVAGAPDGTIEAIPLDSRRARITGPAVRLASGAYYLTESDVAASVSRDGSLAYVHGTVRSRIAIVDEHGAIVPGGRAEAEIYGSPRLSPDGRRVAVALDRDVANDSTTTDIWIYDIGSAVLSRLTSAGLAFRPEWTTDGRYVLFMRRSPMHRGELWAAAADGSAPEVRVPVSPANDYREVAVAPDGHTAILREDSDARTNRDLWALTLGTLGDTTTRTATPLFTTRAFEFAPAVSRDGHWLAYGSDESGQREVYVRPFPGPGGRSQVTSGGGEEPRWMPDGRLTYRSGKTLYAATLERRDDGTVTVKARTALFEATFATDPFHAWYDVTPDGHRFVGLTKSDSDAQELVVVLNAARLVSAGAVKR